MTRRCSHCSNNGHNSRTCPTRAPTAATSNGGGHGGGGVRLFGVRLTDGSFMKKSASMGNLSHYYNNNNNNHASSSSAATSPPLPDQPGSPAHDPVRDGYLSDDPNHHVSCSSSNRRGERKKGGVGVGGGLLRFKAGSYSFLERAFYWAERDVFEATVGRCNSKQNYHYESVENSLYVFSSDALRNYDDMCIRSSVISISSPVIYLLRIFPSGKPWTEEEHRLFLIGLQKLGKGDWRGIARSYVISRTPTQVASHAQKYFIRQSNATRRKRRSSLFDMVPDMVAEGPENVSEEQSSPPQPDLRENDSCNALPSLDLSLGTESEPMETTPTEEIKETQEIPALPPPIPTFFIPIPYPPSWKQSSIQSETEILHHQVLKPTPIHRTEPVNVDHLVGMSQLNLSETENGLAGQPQLSLSLLGPSSRQSAFHASAPAGTSSEIPEGKSSSSSAIQAKLPDWESLDLSFLCTLWTIWGCRCKKIFQEEPITPYGVMKVYENSYSLVLEAEKVRSGRLNPQGVLFDHPIDNELTDIRNSISFPFISAKDYCDQLELFVDASCWCRRETAATHRPLLDVDEKSFKGDMA
ncbi:hypothetical protein KSS87_002760 [Heliosperma pusillum]|nr:hypothetical protein KSS87_002760 [Heliosperma pusillum]